MEDFNPNVFITHLPSKNKDICKDILEDNYTKKFIKPDNIDIVIPITPDQVENSYLIKQLKLNGYNYYNSITEPIVWEKADKVKYVYESLKLCTNEYALVMDGNDTVIINDLTNMVDEFNKYEGDIVFNAEIYKYKKLVKDCLNGGVAFGKTDALLKFYQCAVESLDKDINTKGKKYPSEQKYLMVAVRNSGLKVRRDCMQILIQCYNYEFKKRGDFYVRAIKS